MRYFTFPVDQYENLLDVTNIHNIADVDTCRKLWSAVRDQVDFYIRDDWDIQFADDLCHWCVVHHIDRAEILKRFDYSLYVQNWGQYHGFMNFDPMTLGAMEEIEAKFKAENAKMDDPDLVEPDPDYIAESEAEVDFANAIQSILNGWRLDVTDKSTRNHLIADEIHLNLVMTWLTADQIHNIIADMLGQVCGLTDLDDSDWVEIMMVLHGYDQHGYDEFKFA